MAEYIMQIDNPELCVEYGGTNYTDRLERIVRCRNCKWYVKAETMWDTDEWCIRCKDDDCGVFETESDGFCKWGKLREE